MKKLIVKWWMKTLCSTIFICNFATMKLPTKYWTSYNCDLIRDEYQNWRTYLGLVDSRSWEPVVDISENHVELSDDDIYGRLEGHEAIVIDNDFCNCFENERNAKIWLRDNLNICVITWDIDWWPVLYIKK